MKTTWVGFGTLNPPIFADEVFARRHPGNENGGMPREVDPYIEFAAELAFIMTEKTREYFACMLRVWSVRDDQKAILRASLQNAQTGERRGFASLAELFDYLRVQAEAMLDPKVIEKKKTDDVKSGETKPVDLKGSQKLGVNSIELRSLRSG